MTLREDAIVRDDGSEGIYAVVHKPTCALVIALQDDHVHLVSQHRHPLGERRWEFPQGTAPDRVELEPAELAARELREETGLVAARWTVLGRLDVAPGMTSQRGWTFLAQQLDQRQPERELEEQDMHSRWWSRRDLENAIHSGSFTDAQSLAAYAQLLVHERTRR